MATLENKFRVAIFDQFLESFAKIPRAQQKKVHTFLRKFRTDPTSSAINYEKIKDFSDPNLRTVRIDDAYRAIILKPDTGNVYVLLWVDHHDEAMSWARHKHVEVHPETGGLQVYTLDEAAPQVCQSPRPAAAKKEAGPPSPPVFASVVDADLVAVGVPEAMLPRVREIRAAAELDLLAAQLPADAHEALVFLADGEPVDEVKRAIGLEQPKPNVDRTDFVTALETEASKRTFALVTDDQALQAMLEAPLEKWRVFLHPSQRQLVERTWNGPVRVLGGAGTGKTVVAMHRAAWLAQNIFTADDDRILFTTYTANLAADIKDQIAHLVPPPVLRRIEIVHLDAWVTGYLQSQGYKYRITYYDRGSELEDAWRQALDQLPPGTFPARFVREEWEYVAQPQGCRTEGQYLEAGRSGRGVRLNRAQRKQLWSVFAEYRNLLEEKGLRENVDAMLDAASLLERTGRPLGYRSVLVDEAQDMSTTAFRLLRHVVPASANDMFIVGDGHQKIYRRFVSLRAAGVEIIGRSKRLRVNYRTTDELRRFAVSLLDGVAVDDLNEGSDSMKGYRSLMHGAPPRFVGARDFGAEVDTIAEFTRTGEPARTCLVARTNELAKQYAAALASRGIDVREIRRAEADDPRKPGLRVATMHRVKGLEFDRVVIAGATEDTLPLKVAVADIDDPVVKADAERQERALVYVALTRARREALVTWYGKGSRLLPAR